MALAAFSPARLPRLRWLQGVATVAWRRAHVQRGAKLQAEEGEEEEEGEQEDVALLQSYSENGTLLARISLRLGLVMQHYGKGGWQGGGN